MANIEWKSKEAVIKTQNILEDVHIEHVLKMVRDGDIAICIRVNNPQGGLDRISVVAFNRYMDYARSRQKRYGDMLDNIDETRKKEERI